MTGILFDWSDEKNKKLFDEREITFEEIVHFIENGNLISNISHPNQKKYPGQHIFIVYIRDTVYLVPYIQENNKVFLKTIIPSRKAKRDYLGDKK